MTSAIEAMAKAYIEAEPCEDHWDDAPELFKGPVRAGMRAALLALAEVEITDERFREYLGSGFSSYGREKVRLFFPQFIRALAEEKP